MNYVRGEIRLTNDDVAIYNLALRTALACLYRGIESHEIVENAGGFSMTRREQQIFHLATGDAIAGRRTDYSEIARKLIYCEGKNEK